MTKRKPSHPGLILKRRYMVPLNLSVTAVAQTLGVSRKTVSTIINGWAGISPDLALRLSRAFSTSAEFWLNLQLVYSLWEAAHASSKWKKVVSF